MTEFFEELRKIIIDESSSDILEVSFKLKTEGGDSEEYIYRKKELEESQ